MKYWIVAGLAIALGLTAGYLSTNIEFRSSKELFLINFYPDGVPDEVDEIQTVNAPRVVISNGEIHDFGSMEKKETKRHAFEFKNAGEAPLELRVLNTSCKCTLSSVDSATIQPGDTFEVELEWTPEDYSRSFSQVAKIKTNDPLRDIVEIRVRGQVIQPIWAYPERLVVTKVLSSVGFDEEVYVFGQDDSMDIERVELSDEATRDLFDIEYERLEADSEFVTEAAAGTGFRIRVVAKSGLPLEPMKQSLLIHSSLADSEPLEIPVRGNVTGDISFNVQQGFAFDKDNNMLEFGLIGKGGMKEARIGLVVRGEHAQDVKMWIEEDGVHPAGILQAEIEESRTIGSNEMFPLHILVPKGCPPIDRLGPTRDNLGRIEILTDHPVDKKITVYVRFGTEG